jgi:hypothetical protein
MALLDLSDAYLKGVRVIGHSGSVISDMQVVIEKTERGELAPIRSVAAVGSLNAARDGMQAIMDASFLGKILIYPNIKEFPLTPLLELKDKLPGVYARLRDGREWTKEAEEEFLRLMLP